MNRILSSLLFLLVLSGASLADCRVHYQGRQGERSDGTIANAKAGQPCHIPVYLGGPGMRASGTQLAGITIVRPPKHGKLRTEGASFTYTPSASFPGKDSFFVRFPMQTPEGKRRKGAGVRFAVSG